MGLFSSKKQANQQQARPSPCPQGNAKLQPPGRHQGNTHHRPIPSLPPSPFHPAQFLPPPPPPPPPYLSWNPSRPAHPVGTPAPAPAPHCSQGPRQYPPIIVNQHYYLHPPPPQPQPGPREHASNPYPTSGGGHTSSRLKLGSTSNLIQLPTDVVDQIFDDGLPRWHEYGTQLINQGAALFDQISTQFDNVMTLIDRDKFTGNEDDLFVYQQPSHVSSSHSSDMSDPSTVPRGGQGKKKSKETTPKGQTSAIAASLTTIGYFAKVDLYANSKLPFDLPPFRVPIAHCRLLCLAAQFSERVYDKPRGAERDAHVEANWKTGARAMYIKSVPVDDMGAIIFAIRGTATFMDWAINLNTAPTAPTGFLDDAGNLCHAGFLSVAKKMIDPVAARLRQLLEEDPGRCSHSLLITGHSAGGAVASLLYMHMLSKAVSSNLNNLTGFFRRIHCVTFGSPPVSLIPLQTPHGHAPRKSLFYSFVNEGDPVTRADKAYVKSLLELFATPAPATVNAASSNKSLVVHTKPPPKPQDKKSKFALTPKTSKPSVKSSRSTQSDSSTKTNKLAAQGPIWKVPPTTLSNAGRIVVLRSAKPHAKVKRTKTVEERLDEGVVAHFASDEKLRGVIWGDPVCHVMRLYAARIEKLTVEAVTAKDD
ncbi:alpha/beta-hydrolase [Nemania sp. FL0031]|nr:alpha/beta-hydrolase [Nemania sp. FL0031]